MLSKQSETLYLTDDYIQMPQWVKMINNIVRESASELSTSSIKSLNDWADLVSGLTFSLYVFTFLKSDALTEVVFSFDLLLPELVCDSINEGVGRLIIEWENLKEFSSFVLLGRILLISESAFSNSSSFHFCYSSSANSLKLTWEWSNRLFLSTLTEWTTWIFPLTGLYTQ